MINVLTEGTTYIDMFAPEGHCLFNHDSLRAMSTQWEIVSFTPQEFSAPNDTRKVFATVIACKPC